MHSIARLRLLAGQAESVVLPIVQEGKVYIGQSSVQNRCKMLPPNNIPSAVSLLPTESKEPVQPQCPSTSNTEHRSQTQAGKHKSSLQKAWPLPHERGQQQAHGPPAGLRHHAVPALEAALQGAEINKIRDGTLFLEGVHTMSRPFRRPGFAFWSSSSCAAWACPCVLVYQSARSWALVSILMIYEHSLCQRGVSEFYHRCSVSRLWQYCIDASVATRCSL